MVLEMSKANHPNYAKRYIRSISRDIQGVLTLAIELTNLQLLLLLGNTSLLEFATTPQSFKGCALPYESPDLITILLGGDPLLIE